MGNWTKSPAYAISLSPPCTATILKGGYNIAAWIRPTFNAVNVGAAGPVTKNVHITIGGKRVGLQNDSRVSIGPAGKVLHADNSSLQILNIDNTRLSDKEKTPAAGWYRERP